MSRIGHARIKPLASAHNSVGEPELRITIGDSIRRDMPGFGVLTYPSPVTCGFQSNQPRFSGQRDDDALIAAQVERVPHRLGGAVEAGGEDDCASDGRRQREMLRLAPQIQHDEVALAFGFADVG